jgi:hypothetical protein
MSSIYKIDKLDDIEIDDIEIMKMIDKKKNEHKISILLKIDEVSFKYYNSDNVETATNIICQYINILNDELYAFKLQLEEIGYNYSK